MFIHCLPFRRVTFLWMTVKTNCSCSMATWASVFMSRLTLMNEMLTIRISDSQSRDWPSPNCHTQADALFLTKVMLDILEIQRCLTLDTTALGRKVFRVYDRQSTSTLSIRLMQGQRKHWDDIYDTVPVCLSVHLPLSVYLSDTAVLKCWEDSHLPMEEVHWIFCLSLVVPGFTMFRNPMNVNPLLSTKLLI